MTFFFSFFRLTALLFLQTFIKITMKVSHYEFIVVRCSILFSYFLIDIRVPCLQDLQFKFETSSLSYNLYRLNTVFMLRESMLFLLPLGYYVTFQRFIKITIKASHYEFMVHFLILIAVVFKSALISSWTISKDFNMLAIFYI